MMGIAVRVLRVRPAGHRLARGGDGREVEVRVAEAPSDGAANDAAIRLIAKAFGISRSEVSIISGRDQSS